MLQPPGSPPFAVSWVARHLIAAAALVIAGCGFTHLDEEPELRRFEFAMEAELPAANGEPTTIWLPVPVADETQELGPVWPTAKGGEARESYDARGNRFLSLTGRPPLRLGYVVEVRRLSLTPPLEPGETGMASADDPWLVPAALAPLELVRKEALFQTARHVGAWAKARALFEFVVESIAEDPAPGVYQDRGDLARVWRVRSGDASGTATVFVAMCQSVGIPASLEVGYRLPQSDGEAWRPLAGAHYWARVFVSGLGWLAVDAALARRVGAPRDDSADFGGLDADRIRLTRGRDLVLAPPQRGAPRNIVAGPYAETSAGVEVADLTVRVRYRDLQPAVR